MSSVVLWAEAEARVSARKELLQALLDWTASARREPDVLTARAYEDLERHATFAMVVEWRDDAALEAHLRSSVFGVLLGALEVLTQSFRFALTRAAGGEASDALPMIRRLRESGQQAPRDPKATR